MKPLYRSLMRSALPFFFFASATVAQSACAEKKERRRIDDEEVVSSTSGIATAPPSSSHSGSTPLDPPPQVEIGLAAIRVDDELAGSPTPIENEGRMRKVDDVFDKLKARREKWRADHPTEPFAGVVGIRVDPETKLVVFKSVFQTAAFAGYGNISVMVIGKPKTIVDLDAQIPRPPVPASEIPEPRERNLHVQVDRKDERTMMWKQGSTVIVETRLPSDDAEATKKICDDWAVNGAHTIVTDAKIDDAVVHFGNDMKFAEAMPLLAGIASCKRDIELAGKKHSVPAFRITFSVR